MNQNFQMFKLDFKKAEEQEIKLPTSTGSQKNQENSRKISAFASLTILKPLIVWITGNRGKDLKETGMLTHLNLLPMNPVCRARSNS